jgi:hypothetical protein
MLWVPRRLQKWLKDMFLKGTPHIWEQNHGVLPKFPPSVNPLNGVGVWLYSGTRKALMFDGKTWVLHSHQAIIHQPSSTYIQYIHV